MGRTKEELEAYKQDCVDIDEFDIQGEYRRVSSDYAYWSAEYAEAYKDHLQLKLKREIRVAELTSKCRDILAVESKGRVTVGEVEALVIVHEDYVLFKFDELKADARVKELSGVTEAIKGKREMLISLGAHMRAEMQADPTIRG